jgi:serine/threonine-protein kinase
VLLTLAGGKPVDMGVTFVEAMERRRSVPDLSLAPERLRPLLARMLAPDPADRLRSMADVIAALDGAPTLLAPPPRLLHRHHPWAGPRTERLARRQPSRAGH